MEDLQSQVSDPHMMETTAMASEITKVSRIKDYNYDKLALEDALRNDGPITLKAVTNWFFGGEFSTQTVRKFLVDTYGNEIKFTRGRNGGVSFAN